MKTLGFELYHGPSMLDESREIVVIATLSTTNRKIGNMVQIWIISAEEDSNSALKNGRNAGVCGTCALQGTYNGTKIEDRVCYVNLGQGPRAIYEAWKNDRYAKFDRSTDEPLLRNREIRFGAYGDPAAIPDDVLRYLEGLARDHGKWTGYTHQAFWIDRERADWLSSFLMISCHTPAMHAEARRRGWRSFVAIAEGQTPPENAVECPAYTRGVQCDKCSLCKGGASGAKDVYVLAHAKVGRNLGTVQEMQGVAV